MSSKVNRPRFGVLVTSLAALVCASASLPARELPAPPPKSAENAARVRAAQDLLGQLPVYFEANEGQANSRVKFYSRSPEHTLFLTEDEAVLSIRGGALRMTLDGLNPNTSVEGVERLASRSDYMLGRQQEKWATGVPHFARVRYREAYPGIDLVYYGRGRQMEHDFVVAPGADPTRIRMKFSGADEMRISSDGTLTFQVAGSEMHFSAPYVYQESEEERIEIAGRFVQLGEHEVGFAVEDYDRSRTLVIDPVLSYSTYVGGSFLDTAVAVAVDAQGYIWLTGYTETQDFPTAGEGLQEGGGDLRNVFLVKLNPFAVGLNSLVYSSFMGGVFVDEPSDLALDSAGNVYVVGTTFSGDFPATDNGYTPDDEATNQNAFMVKVNIDTPGTPPIKYGTYLGGEEGESAYGVAVTDQGMVYVTGITYSEDFPVVNGAQPSGRGAPDAFAAVFDTNLSGTASLRYSTYFGGDSTDTGIAVVPGDGGIFYFTGSTFSSDFPSSGTPISSGPVGGGDLFLVGIDMNVSGLLGFVYGSYIGGSALDVPMGMKRDAAGQLVIAGHTLSENFPITADAIQQLKAGDPNGPETSDVFVTVLDMTKPGAQAITYSTFFGGADDDVTYGLSLGQNGHVLVAGYTYSTDLPVRGDFYQSSYSGVVDAFFAVIDPSKAGDAGVTCSSYFGTANLEAAYGMALDSLDNIYLVGEARSSAFPVTESGFQRERPGKVSGFVSKFNACAGTGVEQPADYRPYPVNSTGRSANRGSGSTVRRGTRVR